ncbi:LamG domain-containing protein [Ruficoccus sp. ZRK36]|uniref:LamG domain-containing protein n=1 Tax=Ruficoccus sp. ZRK36 TaxID=2866311 RepID=UPI001C72ADC0|nr:LamG domain-containing protein [Ruficoccus sp. ZRK36]QYY35314.1 LamG domain-containing protein [Ruficoccus sp. ZRK36]
MPASKTGLGRFLSKLRTLSPNWSSPSKFVREDGALIELPGGGDMLGANNLAELTDAAASRANLGVYSKVEAEVLAAKPFGSALYLDGSTGVVQAAVTGTGVALAGHTRTVLAWVKCVDDGSTTLESIISAGGSASGGWHLGVEGADRSTLAFGTKEDSANSNYKTWRWTNALTADRWHSICMVLNFETPGAEVVTAYVDGVALPSPSVSIEGTTYGDSTEPLRFGVRGPSTSPWQGFMTAAAFYNYGLTAPIAAARFGNQPTEPIASATDLRGWLDLLDSASAWQDTTHPYSTFTGDGVDGFEATVASSSDRRAYLLTNTKLSAGDRVRVEFDIACDIPGAIQGSLYNPVSTAGSGSGIAFMDEEWGGIAEPTGGLDQGFVEFTGNGHATYEGTITATISNMVAFRFATTSTGPLTLTVSNFSIRRIGASVYSASQAGRAGYQLNDLSSNGYHGLISATGGFWTEPTLSDSYRATGVDASSPSGMYLGRAGDLMPANAIVTSVVVDGTVYAITAAQDVAERRIQLLPNGSDLDVRRSDGSNTTTLVSAAAVSDLSDVSIIINFQTF